MTFEEVFWQVVKNCEVNLYLVIIERTLSVLWVMTNLYSESMSKSGHFSQVAPNLNHLYFFFISMFYNKRKLMWEHKLSPLFLEHVGKYKEKAFPKVLWKYWTKYFLRKLCFLLKNIELARFRESVGKGHQTCKYTISKYCF